MALAREYMNGMISVLDVVGAYTGTIGIRNGDHGNYLTQQKKTYMMALPVMC